MKEFFKLLPEGYIQLYHGANIQNDDPLGSYLASTTEEVLTLYEQGIDRDYIYFASLKEKDAIKKVIGKCRMVANNYQELLDINDIAVKQNKQGYLETIGLRVIPTLFDDKKQMGFPELSLEELGKKIKKMPGISIRGCFVQAAIERVTDEKLAGYFHESYQMVKRMTTLLPCSMPYFCLCDTLKVLKNMRELCSNKFDKILLAASIVGMQNQTAFYARLLID